MQTQALPHPFTAACVLGLDAQRDANSAQQSTPKTTYDTRNRNAPYDMSPKVPETRVIFCSTFSYFTYCMRGL